MTGRVQKNCNDCARFLSGKRGYICAACVRERHRLRCRRYQARWNASAKAKIVKARYEEQHAVAIRARHHARYLAHRQPRPTVLAHCRTLLCDGTFVRPRGSHRWLCDECAVANYGPAYLRGRAA